MNARLEKLKIVLGTFAIEGTERNFSGDKVREIHANRGIEFKVIIDHIAQSAKTLDMPLEFQRGDGKIFSISEFQDFVIHRGNWGASVFLGSLKVQAGLVASVNVV